jgi:hypothetical protein
MYEIIKNLRIRMSIKLMLNVLKNNYFLIILLFVWGNSSAQTVIYGIQVDTIWGEFPMPDSIQISVKGKNYEELDHFYISVGPVIKNTCIMHSFGVLKDESIVVDKQKNCYTFKIDLKEVHDEFKINHKASVWSFHELGVLSIYGLEKSGRYTNEVFTNVLDKYANCIEEFEKEGR